MAKTRINFYSVKMIKDKGALYELETKVISSPEDGAKAMLQIFELETATKEHFVLLALDTKNRIAGAHVVHVGALNASIVHPREVFQLALLNNAASIIVSHNHPSGDPTPSREDIAVTKRLAEAGKIMGIELIDHIVTGDDGRFVSLKEKGYV